MAAQAPVRTCVGCRTRAPAPELVRLTLDPGGSWRVGGPSAGRGAWVGPGPACLSAAIGRLGPTLGIRQPGGQRALEPLVVGWVALLAAAGRSAEAPPWCPLEQK